ncbi:MAG: hypothetical protein R6X16_08090 [Anaerolineae bacterium]
MRAILRRASRMLLALALVLMILATLVACQAAPGTPAATTPATAAAQVTPTPAPPITARPTSTQASALPSTTPVQAQAPTASPEPTEQAGADLAVWSTHDRAVGEGAVTYRVHYANLDTERAADGVVLQIVIPEGAKIARVSREFEVTFDGALVPLGAVQPAQIGGVEIALQWPEALPPGTQAILNAQINQDGVDPDLTNNVAQDSELSPAPDLALRTSLAGDSSPFVPGGTVKLRLAYVNLADVRAQAATITATLPSGLYYIGANGNLSGEPLVSGMDGGVQVVLPLQPVGSGGGKGNVYVQAQLDAAAQPGDALTWGAEIGAPGEASLVYNRAESTQIVQNAGPDVWVTLESTGETSLERKHAYRVAFGNLGTERAANVVLSLTLPASLGDVRFGREPASLENGIATWKFESLGMAQAGRPFEVTGVIVTEGPAVASANITTTGTDANPGNDSAEVTDEMVALAMPTILGPSAAIIDDQPAFYGVGTRGATVSLYLAATETEPAVPLGMAVVDGGGKWAMAPTEALPAPGWHWFTATQTLGERVSPVTGVANFVSEDTGIDTDSLTVNGTRVGGIDQAIAWPAGQMLTFGAQIVDCAAPLTPALLASYYDRDDVLVNREAIPAASMDANGKVTFAFRVPRLEQQLQWTLGLSYTCEGAPQTKALASTLRPARYLAAPLAGFWDDLKCWFGFCEETPPPPPPPKKQCPGCTPLDPNQRKKKPTFLDPDPDDNDFSQPLSVGLIRNLSGVTLTSCDNPPGSGGHDRLEASPLTPLRI